MGVISDLLQEVERIEREKNGRALTDEEVKTLKAAEFLRKIAPYLFADALGSRTR